MTRRIRRRSGLTLLTLLAVQSVAAPLGACAQEHEQHDDTAHEMEMMGHADAGGAMGGMTSDQATESHHAPDSAPVDCLALAACGAPAIGSSIATAQVALADPGTRTLQSVPQEPAAIVLGLTTPPPKI